MRAPLLPLCGCLVALGCGGVPETAAQNRTFYDWSVAGPGGATDAFEQRYPPLDEMAREKLPAYEGYTVLRGAVNLSRPQDWRLQDASNEPGQAYIQYISPNAYSFAIYERPESPSALWGDVMRRFEEDVSAAGAKLVGSRVPMASFGAQGRAYTVERSVEAPKSPLVSRSREILMRGERRVVLVQIVFQGEDLSPLDDELLRVVRTLEVL